VVGVRGALNFEVRDGRGGGGRRVDGGWWVGGTEARVG
jgi:hypothetical protein